MSNASFAVALWDHVPQEKDEIGFKAGDLIRILEVCNEDWLAGYINGKTGYIPSNRVRILSEQEVSDLATTVQQTINASTDHLKTTVEAGPTSDTIMNQNAKLDHSSTIESAIDTNELPIEATFENNQTIEPTISPTEPFIYGIPATEEPLTEEAVIMRPPSPLQRQETINDADSGFRSLYTINPRPASSIQSQFIADSVIHSQRDSELRDNQDSVLGDWQALVDEEGNVYYWNPTTNRTSWNPPLQQDDRPSTPTLDLEHLPPVDHLNMSPSSADSTKKFDYVNIELLSHIPKDFIVKEGLLNRKCKFDEGGKDAKHGTSWRLCWIVLCPGIIIIFKEPPSKSNNNHPSKPCQIFKLDGFITVQETSKDQTKKQSAFSLHSDSGQEIYFYAPSDAAQLASQWIEEIQKNTTNALGSDKVEEIRASLFSSTSGRPSRRKPTMNKKKSIHAEVTQGPDSVEGGTLLSKINKVFQKKSSSKILEKINDKSLFGGCLTNHLDEDGIPKLMKDCIQAIEGRGMTSQGIYRLSAQTAIVHQIKHAYVNNEAVDLMSEDLDINAVTGLLKSYLRELKEPIIPFSMYEAFIEIAKIEDYDERMLQLKDTVHQLPTMNYNILAYLMDHLKRVISFSEENKMQASNIGIIFGPSLLRAPNDAEGEVKNMMNMGLKNCIIEWIVQHKEWIFQN